MDQTSPDGRLSRDSSISLEDHNGPAPNFSRSDLYTAHQVQREANYHASLATLSFFPLDFPTTYDADEISTGEGLSDPVDEPGLSARRLEPYLSDERRDERIALGGQVLGVNRATVQQYLPELIQSADNNISQAEPTVGTIEPEEGVCWGSFTTLASTTSDGSSGPIIACNNNNDDEEATNSRSFPTTTSLEQHFAPTKSQYTLTSNESHLIAQDTAECDLELENTVRNFYKTNPQRRRSGYRTENLPRIKKIVRFNRRSEKRKMKE